jgi:hypothetical protein
VGKIKKAIKLETTRESLIASVDRVIVDPKTGDLLIGDFRRANRVFRFSNKGTFICNYGKTGNGPGEYHNLKSFTITGNSDVILLTSLKLIKYSKAGTFLRESRIPVFAGCIECVNDLLYISVLRYRGNPGEKKAIIVLNTLFSKVGSVGDYDIRLEKYIFNIRDALAKSEKKLYFIDYYDPTLKIYDSSAKRLIQLQIPNKNSVLDKIWQKSRINDNDDKKILSQLHRFNSIKIVDNRILLMEINRANKTYRSWLLNLTAREVHIFDRSVLFGDYRIEDKPDIYFNRVPGTYDNGIIGVMDDVENFDLHKNKYPLLKDIQFKADDNPILVFFELYQDR